MARRRPLSPAEGAPSSRRGQIKERGNDDENGNTESQQILAVGSLLKKPKHDDKEMQQFRTTVATERKRMKQLLDQRVRQAEKEESRRRTEIASTIVNALQKPSRAVQGDAPTFAGTTIAENSAYTPVPGLLAASAGLIAEYERLDDMVTNMQDDQAGSLAETWTQDLQEAETQLKLGARVALRNVKKVLGADVEDELKQEKDGDEDMANEGEHELNFELNDSLRYAERGVRRMVKGIPTDER
ncbi:hypothetical protein EK21DRAFT_51354 [Setomelanomma holmii]|uniref:Uncharacterized protein n=1 Tax=Setomelanomma holmii TaxID=210430 RepID=A0A9P4HNH5_9PLEO|nr:hypothetical protein EK21DRAFT_51354 [Setomelanomma holmii]